MGRPKGEWGSAISPEGTLPCTNCKAVLPATPEYFSPDPRHLSRAGLDGRCRACERARLGKHHHRHWIERRWRALLARTKSRGGAPPRLEDLRAAFAEPRCSYCGLESVDPRWMQLDHIVPVSRGGTSERSNLCLACEPCNRAKGVMSADEYLAWLDGVADRVLARRSVLRLPPVERLREVA